MKSFRERVGKEVLVFDGGVGTCLYEKGIFINTCFDELNLVNPDIVGEVHRDYVNAGADVIETNTFGANRFKLAAHGLEELAVEAGTPFDPTYHEAVLTQPSEEHDEGTVLRVLERGYLLHGRLLRPAKVIVAN